MVAETASRTHRRNGKWVLSAIAALLLSAGVIVGSAYWALNREIDAEIRTVLSSGGRGEQVIVTLEMLAGLPAPVQRYMNFSGIVGHPIPQTVRLIQRGRIRSDADSAWMNFEAIEVYSVSPPSFVWKVWLPSRGMPIALGRDQYLESAGRILIEVGGLFTLADAQGPEVDQGSLLRLLNEMTWFPAAFLSDGVSWRGIDENRAEVTLTDRERSVSAVMSFDADGRPTNFVAQRYRAVGAGFELDTWSTPFTAFGEFEGVTVPVAGTGVWALESGDLAYIEITVTGVEYDP